MSTFGSWLRQRRIALNIPRPELAKVAGVSRQTIQYAEHDHHKIRPGTKAAIVHAVSIFEQRQALRDKAVLEPETKTAIDMMEAE
jgi:DNA-binding XRE family transcriptional regulator